MVAERLRSKIENSVIQTERGEITITVSIGIADLSDQVDNVERLVDNADQALLQAKQNGRNRIEIWNTG